MPISLSHCCYREEANYRHESNTWCIMLQFGTKHLTIVDKFILNEPFSQQNAHSESLSNFSPYVSMYTSLSYLWYFIKEPHILWRSCSSFVLMIQPGEVFFFIIIWSILQFDAYPSLVSLSPNIVVVENEWDFYFRNAFRQKKAFRFATLCY